MATMDVALLARQHVDHPVVLAVMEPVFATFHPLMERVDVGPTPLTLPLNWGTIEGTDAADVPRTTLLISPPATGHSDRGEALGALPSWIDGGALVVEVPIERRIRSLHLADLETDEDSPVDLAGHDSLGSWRLSVSPANPGGGWASPVVCVPPVPARGQVPQTLVGGAFHDRVLSLPDVAGRHLRISLVSGSTPDDFTAVPITAGTVTGWAAPIPRDLTVTAPDGSTVWVFPGEFLPGSANATVDLTAGLQSSVSALLAEGAPVNGEVSISAKYPARIHMAAPTLRGALTRRISGTITTELVGSPVTTPVEGEPLPVPEPTSVAADVRVTYDGIRIAEISDLLPDSRAVAGRVVGSDPVVRTLPPTALIGQKVARVGVVGRAHDPADLTLRLVGSDQEAIAPPTVVPVEGRPESADVDVVWAVFDPPVEVSGPVGISLAATKGEFLWVGDPEPNVRLAIVDPDPGGRPILLADRPLLTLDRPEVDVERAALPVEVFAGGASRLTIASPLFCTVELTDLELRYVRPETS